jgi:hypothetical protein
MTWAVGGMILGGVALLCLLFCLALHAFVSTYIRVPGPASNYAFDNVNTPPPQTEADRDAHRDGTLYRLRQMAESIQEYRGQHQSFPPRLEDLNSLDKSMLHSPFGPFAGGSDYEYHYFNIPHTICSPNFVVVLDQAEAHTDTGATVLLGDGSISFIDNAKLPAALATSKAYYANQLRDSQGR